VTDPRIFECGDVPLQWDVVMKIEVAAMGNAELRVIESGWGHCAASRGRNAGVMRRFESAFAGLLSA